MRQPRCTVVRDSKATIETMEEALARSPVRYSAVLPSLGGSRCIERTVVSSHRY